MTATQSFDSVSADTTVVAADRLAAQQWEAHLARKALEAGVSAWSGPAVLSYRAWVRELWSLHHGSHDAGLLTPGQSHALWKRVIAESAEGSTLIGVGGAAGWAEDARRRVLGWRLPAIGSETAHQQEDSAAFLRWHDSYQERLASSGWIDEPQLDAALTQKSIAPGSIQLTDPARPLPSREVLFARLESQGWSVARLESPSLEGVARRAPCSDERDELREAARWARRRLSEAGGGRVAIVVPGLAHRGPEIRRSLLDELASATLFIAAESDMPVDARPLTGAAVNAMEMLSPGGTFGSFSRWLRSPFFHGGDPDLLSRMARVEAQLRLDMVTQLPFVEAFRRGGLRERLGSQLPQVGIAIEAALAELGAGKARSPSEWARLWPRVLHRLGWPGWPVPFGATESREQRVWEKALAELALLTPIVGRLSPGRALAELEANLQRGGAAPLPLEGVHVFGEMDDVGPGYIGAWVTGCTDTALPRPTRLNPLLPRDLQITHGMPWCSPQDSLRRSLALMRQLEARVPACVFSWPAREHEQSTEPSPLLRGVPPLELDDGHDTSEEHRRRAARRRTRQRSTCDDPAPPLLEHAIGGGTGTLNAQARSPIRAFCQYRLGARPLEPLGRGIPLRLQGMALHAALERIYRRVDSRAKLDALSCEELRVLTEGSVEEALGSAFGGARAALAVLFELESERLATLLNRFARRELERPSFRVVAIEEPRQVELRGRLIRTRIDRIDELADGTLAIIDYKSGRGAQAAAWFSSRPSDWQLPLYAVALGSNVSALVIATLRAEGVGYAGLWESSPKEFPNRPRRLGDGMALLAQLDVWRDALGALVDEYAAGDTRFFTEDTEPAEGVFAPLTRVYEQLALHRGWLDSWERT